MKTGNSSGNIEKCCILEAAGYKADRDGDHTIYEKENSRPVQVPKHWEINENTARAISDPFHPQAIPIAQGEFVNLIRADVKDGRAVKRTVSIPKWMDDQVSESGLSLSCVLQDALKDRLHVG